MSAHNVLAQCYALLHFTGQRKKIMRRFLPILEMSQLNLDQYSIHTNYSLHFVHKKLRGKEVKQSLQIVSGRY